MGFRKGRFSLQGVHARKFSLRGVTVTLVNCVHTLELSLDPMALRVGPTIGGNSRRGEEELEGSTPTRRSCERNSDVVMRCNFACCVKGCDTRSHGVCRSRLALRGKGSPL